MDWRGVINEKLALSCLLVGKNVANPPPAPKKAVQDLENELVQEAEQETEIKEGIFTEMAPSFDDNEEKGPPI